jgi:hypothetical protein
LKFANEQEVFQESIDREKNPIFPSSIVQRVLDVKPQGHFGEAHKRLQSLFFMLQESQDVFEVFKKNAYKIRYQTNGTFPETMMNFLFNDITSLHSNSRLCQVVKHIIKTEIEYSGHPDQLIKGFLETIFNQIVSQSESRRYLIYLFKSKYDRIDFNYLNQKNIYDVYRGFSIVQTPSLNKNFSTDPDSS